MSRHLPGHLRLCVALACGVLTTALLALVIDGVLATLAGITVMSGLFVAVSLIEQWPLDPGRTRSRARRDNVKPTLEEILVVSAALASLAGTIALFFIQNSGHAKLYGAGLGLAAIGCTWLMLHTMYAARYAHLYYLNEPGGLDFKSDVLPQFSDFFYFSFTVGMSFAVSDVDVSTAELRKVIIRHALLSYLFATVILASMVNLVATILSQN